MALACDQRALACDQRRLDINIVDLSACRGHLAKQDKRSNNGVYRGSTEKFNDMWCVANEGEYHLLAVF